MLSVQSDHFQTRKLRGNGPLVSSVSPNRKTRSIFFVCTMERSQIKHPQLLIRASTWRILSVQTLYILLQVPLQWTTQGPPRCQTQQFQDPLRNRYLHQIQHCHAHHRLLSLLAGMIQNCGILHHMVHSYLFDPALFHYTTNALVCDIQILLQSLAGYLCWFEQRFVGCGESPMY